MPDRTSPDRLGPMLNDIYNQRILELAGNIPRLGRLEGPQATARATAAELRDVRDRVRAMLKANGAPPDGAWADAAVLEPVRDFKARHASTLLAFEAAAQAASEIEAKRSAPV